MGRSTNETSSDIFKWILAVLLVIGVFAFDYFRYMSWIAEVGSDASYLKWRFILGR